MTDKLDKVVEDVVEPASETTTPKAPAKKAPAKKAPAPPKKIRVGQIDKNLEVGFKNNTGGMLVYRCPKHGTLYTLRQHGDEDFMSFDEVLTMKNTKRVFFEKYWVILADVPSGEYTVEQLHEALGIDYLYEGANAVALDLDKFILGSVKTFKEKFPKLNDSLQATTVARARELYANKEIKDIELVRFLSDFTGNSELFSL